MTLICTIILEWWDYNTSNSCLIVKIITTSSIAPFPSTFLLTGGVEHNQGSWIFLQEAVKGLIGQVEDRGACLWPRHLRGLWLGGLWAETGMGGKQGQHRWETFQNADMLELVCNLYEAKKKIKHSCSPHSTQCHRTTSGLKQSRLVDEEQCSLSANEWKQIHVSALSLQSLTSLVTLL